MKKSPTNRTKVSRAIFNAYFDAPNIDFIYVFSIYGRGFHYMFVAYLTFEHFVECASTAGTIYASVFHITRPIYYSHVFKNMDEIRITLFAINLINYVGVEVSY